MNALSCNKRFTLIVTAVFGALTTFAWAFNPPSGYTNIGSVANTRHNLSMLGNTGVGPSGAPLNASMHNNVRNEYVEVCVYCHTPHGANSTVAAPLWNRTIKATTYTLYNSVSLTQTVSQPGNNSLTCLSCHDGQTAIDSIINMPGSGRSLASQSTTQDVTFLNSWTNPVGPSNTTTHLGLNSSHNAASGYQLGNGTGSDGIGCMACHSPVGYVCFDLGAACGNDMRVMNLGTDLSNDHPVGVTFPAANGPGTDWNTPAGIVGSSIYFDTNTNSRMDKAEIRTYEGKVECASCHDPHGVPSAGPGSQFNPTFLRVNNAGSAVCLTCHAK